MSEVANDAIGQEIRKGDFVAQSYLLGRSSRIRVSYVNKVEPMQLVSKSPWSDTLNKGSIKSSKNTTIKISKHEVPVDFIKLLEEKGYIM